MPRRWPGKKEDGEEMARKEGGCLGDAQVRRGTPRTWPGKKRDAEEMAR